MIKEKHKDNATVAGLMTKNSLARDSLIRN